MKHYTISLLIFALLSVSCRISAQETVEEIKNNPDYYWGEGSGMTFEDADNQALAALSRSIWTVIVDDARQHGTTDIAGGEVTSQHKQEIFTKSFTMNTIPNARMFELQPEPDCRVFRYVHKDDIKAMEKQKKQHIIDYFGTGRSAEKRLQIDDALRCYYWCLMLSMAHSSPIYIEVEGKQVDCRSYIPMKIKSVISHLKAELVKCREDGGRYVAQMCFRYNEHEVASLQVWYNDGQSYRGPVSVRDGITEFDLVSLSAKNKIPIRYEYRFKEEASNLDPELEAAFETMKPFMVDAATEVPVKMGKDNDMQGNGTAQVKTSKEDKRHTDAFQNAIGSLPQPEPIREKHPMKLRVVSDASVYSPAITAIEEAIRLKKPELAKVHFDENSEGYKMFTTLLLKTGKVTLAGEQNYNFIEANGLVLARFCRVNIKFRNGKSFTEKIVFRFIPANGKIESLAFALTQKAEADIFNASLKWPEVSKFTIQRFMEDYQTAYALKRLDYIERIFSDDALIITGSVLTPTKGLFHEVEFNFGQKTKNVRYTRQNKTQYLNRLRQHFRDREYIHLSFEDNQAGPINTQGVLRNGAAFGIQIKQIYSSPVYSDRGYLSLFLNMQGQYPIIEVRFWQPEGEEMISFAEFQNRFQVK